MHASYSGLMLAEAWATPGLPVPVAVAVRVRARTRSLSGTHKQTRACALDSPFLRLKLHAALELQPFDSPGPHARDGRVSHECQLPHFTMTMPRRRWVHAAQVDEAQRPRQGHSMCWSGACMM